MLLYFSPLFLSHLFFLVDLNVGVCGFAAFFTKKTKSPNLLVTTSSHKALDANLSVRKTTQAFLLQRGSSQREYLLTHRLSPGPLAATDSSQLR